MLVIRGNGREIETLNRRARIIFLGEAVQRKFHENRGIIS